MKKYKTQYLPYGGNLVGIPSSFSKAAFNRYIMQGFNPKYNKAMGGKLLAYGGFGTGKPGSGVTETDMLNYNNYLTQDSNADTVLDTNDYFGGGSSNTMGYASTAAGLVNKYINPDGVQGDPTLNSLTSTVSSAVPYAALFDSIRQIGEGIGNNLQTQATDPNTGKITKTNRYNIGAGLVGGFNPIQGGLNNEKISGGASTFESFINPIGAAMKSSNVQRKNINAEIDAAEAAKQKELQIQEHMKQRLNPSLTHGVSNVSYFNALGGFLGNNRMTRRDTNVYPRPYLAHGGNMTNGYSPNTAMVPDMLNALKSAYNQYNYAAYGKVLAPGGGIPVKDISMLDVNQVPVGQQMSIEDAQQFSAPVVTPTVSTIPVGKYADPNPTSPYTYDRVGNKWIAYLNGTAVDITKPQYIESVKILDKTYGTTTPVSSDVTTKPYSVSDIGKPIDKHTGGTKVGGVKGIFDIDEGGMNYANNIPVVPNNNTNTLKGFEYKSKGIPFMEADKYNRYSYRNLIGGNTTKPVATAPPTTISAPPTIYTGGKSPGAYNPTTSVTPVVADYQKGFNTNEGIAAIRQQLASTPGITKSHIAKLSDMEIYTLIQTLKGNANILDNSNVNTYIPHDRMSYAGANNAFGGILANGGSVHNLNNYRGFFPLGGNTSTTVLPDANEQPISNNASMVTNDEGGTSGSHEQGDNIPAVDANGQTVAQVEPGEVIMDLPDGTKYALSKRLGFAQTYTKLNSIKQALSTNKPYDKIKSNTVDAEVRKIDAAIAQLPAKQEAMKQQMGIQDEPQGQGAMGAYGRKLGNGNYLNPEDNPLLNNTSMLNSNRDEWGDSAWGTSPFVTAMNSPYAGGASGSGVMDNNYGVFVPSNINPYAGGASGYNNQPVTYTGSFRPFDVTGKNNAVPSWINKPVATDTNTYNQLPITNTKYPSNPNYNSMFNASMPTFKPTVMPTLSGTIPIANNGLAGNPYGAPTVTSPSGTTNNKWSLGNLSDITDMAVPLAATLASRSLINKTPLYKDPIKTAAPVYDTRVYDEAQKAAVDKAYKTYMKYVDSNTSDSQTRLANARAMQSGSRDAMNTINETSNTTRRGLVNQNILAEYQAKLGNNALQNTINDKNTFVEGAKLTDLAANNWQMVKNYNEAMNRKDSRDYQDMQLDVLKSTDSTGTYIRNIDPVVNRYSKDEHIAALVKYGMTDALAKQYADMYERTKGYTK